LNGQGCERGIWQRVAAAPRSAGEKLQDAVHRLHQDVDFFLGVVNVEAGAGGRCQAEFAHERLVAVVTASERDAILVGEGHHVVRVGFGEGETYESASGLAGLGAEDADAGELGEGGAGFLAEGVIMGADCGPAQGIEIIERGVEADGVGDVGRAGFEPFGGGLPRGTFVGDGHHNAAAGLVRRHGVEECAFAVKHADAGGAGHLVSAEGEEIATDGLHVDRLVSYGLGRVDERDGTDRAGFGAEGCGVGEDAEGVGEVGEREELHLRGEELVERFKIEAEFGIGAEDGHVFQRGTGAEGELLPRDEVGVVLHLGREDDVAGLEVGGAPGLRDEVDRFGRAAGEDDLGGIGGVDEPGGAGAGGFVAVGRAHGKRVEAAMDVGVVPFVEAGESVDHRARLLGGRAVVEIDEGLAADVLVERGKVDA